MWNIFMGSLIKSCTWIFTVFMREKSKETKNDNFCICFKNKNTFCAMRCLSHFHALHYVMFIVVKQNDIIATLASF